MAANRWQPVPPAPGNPMQMKEPYDMFYREPLPKQLVYRLGRLISPYPPNWRRTSNFGTVERRPQFGVVPSVRGVETIPNTQPLPQQGVIPSIRPLAEAKQPYTFHQKIPSDTASPKGWPRSEAYDFSYRGQIGAPRHNYRSSLPASFKESYDFTY